MATKQKKFVPAQTPTDAIGGTKGTPRDIPFATPLADVSRFFVLVRNYGTTVEFKGVPLDPQSTTRPTVVVHEWTPGGDN